MIKNQIRSQHSVCFFASAARKSLPPDLRIVTDTNTFKERRKTVYFTIALIDDCCISRSWTLRRAAPYKFHFELKLELELLQQLQVQATLWSVTSCCT